MVLGSGSTSTVYLATHLPLGRDVAIKKFSPEFKAKESDLARRFQREAAMWARFSHENLIYLYDYRFVKDNQYIIMEYCHGTDLRDILDQRPILPIEVAAGIVYQLLQALEYLHQSGIIHRDLKPANIFIKSDGVVKLMDFGISRSQEMDSMTMPGSIIGTPAYMSPEQSMGHMIDVRTDIYSLGVLLFEMLDGRKPYASEIISDLIQEIAAGKHLKFTKSIPRKWKSWIYGCMEFYAEDRPQSCTQMRVWLEKFFIEQNIISPKRKIQDFLVQNELISQEKNLFPNNFSESTAKGPLKEAFRSISTQEFVADDFPWFWMIFTIGFIIMMFIAFSVYPERAQEALDIVLDPGRWSKTGHEIIQSII